MSKTPIKIAACSLILLLLNNTALNAAPIHGKSPNLSPTQAQAAQISSDWRNEQAIIGPGDDGKVMFLFGQAQPRVVCAPLQLCDIELQAGERVLDVNLGDTVRWSVSPAKSGRAPNEKVHLIIKPFEAGLNTSISVTTDRRVYHISLVSHRTVYMARVGFRYNDQDNATINAAFQAANPATLPQASETPQLKRTSGADTLSFDYTLRGKASWKPLRVFNDGVKTFIDMPPSMSSTEAPALLIVAQGEEKLVNYRIQDNRYIVDQIFDKAILVAGVGRSQNRITIERGS